MDIVFVATTIQPTTTPPATVGPDPFVCPGQQMPEIRQKCVSGSSICGVSAAAVLQPQMYRLLSDSRSLEHFSVDSTGFVALKPAKTLDITEFERVTLIVEYVFSPANRCFRQVLITVDPPPTQKPDFVLPSFTFSVNESMGNGEDIGRVVATFPAKGAQLRYSIPNTDEPFAIHPNTGSISLRRALDREKQEYYDFEVKAEYNGKEASRRVHVVVEDVDDEPPKFDKETFEFDTYEETVFGTIGVIPARDLDTSYKDLVYTFDRSLEQSLSQYFDITLGVVRVKKQLLRSELDQFAFYWPDTATLVFTVHVSDYTYTDSAQVSVRVNKMVLKQTDDIELTGSIYENRNVNSGVSLQYPTQDNNNVLYKLEPESGDFNINEDTGELHSKRMFDREVTPVIRIGVVVVDKINQCQELAVYVVIISIRDENDRIPTMSDTNYQIKIDENFVGNTSLVISGIDEDDGINSEVALTLKGQNNRNFELNSVTESEERFGYNLVVTSSFDYESMLDKSLYLTITAKDGGSPALNSTAQLIITITDLNDNEPVFVNPPTALSVPETDQLTVIHTLSATDKDESENGVFSFFLPSGQDGGFVIDPVTGTLSVAGGLDYEKKKSYIVTVLVVDKGSPPRNSSIDITINVKDVNDNSPVFTENLYRGRVEENDNNNNIIQISATDEDSGAFGKVRYSLSNTTYFGIDTNTGVVSTILELDYETLENSEVTLVVIARDSAVNPQDQKSTTVTLIIECVDVNDERPRFGKASYSAIVRARSVPGTLVTVVKATDRDTPPEILGYRLSTSSQFTVGNDGVVTVMGTVTDSPVSRDLTVTVSDGIQSAHVPLQITIKPDGDKVPTNRKVYNISKPEDVPPNTLLLTTEKINTAYAVKFEFFGPGGFFINSSDNTGYLYSEAAFNRELASSYRGLITITNTVAENQYSQVPVNLQIEDINDNAPRCNQSVYSFSIEENVPSPTIGNIFVHDPDLGSNGTFRYVIIEPLGKFAISSTGELSALAPLDREAEDVYNVNIKVIDNGVPPMTGSCVIQVEVLDRDDTPPEFAAVADGNVTENTIANVTVLLVTANDVDLSQSDIQYRIVPDTPEFRIDVKTGGISTTTTSIDREKDDKFVLTVEAVDQAGNTGSTTVSILVEDVNDNPPVFGNSTYNVTIPSNLTVSHSVVTVNAMDGDAVYNRLTYQRQADAGTEFFVNPYTGEITLASSVQEKTQAAVIFNVVAIDNGYPQQSATTTVAVKIRGNDYAPYFNQSYFTAEIDEEKEGGNAVVIRLQAMDEDQGTVITYSIAPNLTQLTDHFGISDKGTVFVFRKLDREALRKSNFLLTIVATDNGYPPLQNSTLVNVTLRDVNDNKPNFASLIHPVNLSQTFLAGETIHIPTAVDLDIGKHGEIKYELGDEANFTIDKETGVITARNNCTGCVAPQNYPFTTLLVQTYNPGKADISWTGNLFVQITLIYNDPNKSAPKFIDAPSGIEVDMNDNPVEKNTAIVKLEAEDKDGDEIYYRLDGDPRTLSIFKIDEKTGEIKMVYAPDQENYTFNLTVYARDKAPAPKQSLPHYLAITIENGGGAVSEAVRNALIAVAVIAVLITGVLVGLIVWQWRRRLGVEKELKRVRMGAYMQPANRTEAAGKKKKGKIPTGYSGLDLQGVGYLTPSSGASSASAEPKPDYDGYLTPSGGDRESGLGVTNETFSEM